MMRKTIEAAFAAASLAMLAGCGGGNPNQPTAEENRELNNAAAMLDQDASADSLTIQDPALGNGDAPAANAGQGETGGVLVTDESQGSEDAANAGAAVNAQ